MKSYEDQSIVRSERGWGAHYCCANLCYFRRNTLVEKDEIRIVISTVGNMISNYITEKISGDRYYETMVFHAKLVQDIYWDADIQKPITFNSQWRITKLKFTSDMEANIMHENVVSEIIEGLKNGNNYVIERIDDD